MLHYNTHRASYSFTAITEYLYYFIKKIYQKFQKYKKLSIKHKLLLWVIFTNFPNYRSISLMYNFVNAIVGCLFVKPTICVT